MRVSEFFVRNEPAVKLSCRAISSIFQNSLLFSTFSSPTSESNSFCCAYVAILFSRMREDRQGFFSSENYLPCVTIPPLCQTLATVGSELILAGFVYWLVLNRAGGGEFLLTICLIDYAINIYKSKKSDKISFIIILPGFC
jgi:hypothetical protein